jgi:hypothetical protein
MRNRRRERISKKGKQMSSYNARLFSMNRKFTALTPKRIE